MANALRVRILQTEGRLQDQRRGQPWRQRTAQSYESVEVRSLDELHHEVISRLTDSGIVSRHEVRM